MKKIVAIALGLVMLVSVLAFSGCSGDKGQEGTGSETPSTGGGDTIKIGLITPRTGNVAQYGVAVERAAVLAAEQVNEAGGIDGKQIELIIYDNKGDATESINLFNRLVDNDKIDALLGPVISSTTLAVAPLAEERGIPLMTPTATSLEVTPGREFVFRACYIDPYQGGVMGKYASENMQAKSAAVLYDAGDDYSVGLAEAFKETFEASGGTITNYEGYTADEKDFKSVLTKIKEKSPEVMYIPAYYNAVGLIAGQVKEVGLESVLIGGDGWDNVQKEYADAVEGFFFVNHYATDDPDPVVQNFISSYTEKYNETPNALGALGYDGAMILFQAIDAADSLDKVAIKDAMKATEYNGVTGKITFDEDHNPIKGSSIIKIVNGELKLETKVSLDD